MKRIFTSIPAILLFTSLSIVNIAFSHIAHAQTAEERGTEIAKSRPATEFDADDSLTRMKMTLISKTGRRKEREMELISLKVSDELGKSRVVFKSPRKIQGTALLSYTHKNADNEQWLYLPTLGNPKKISAKGKSNSFMGSEFSFEDMDPGSSEDFSYKDLGDKTEEGKSYHQLEATPKGNNSSYSKQIFTIGIEDKLTYQIDFYDLQGELLKTMTLNDYKKYQEKFWRPNIMLMRNHINGKATELTWVDQQFNLGLEEKQFTKNALKRASRKR